MTNANQSHEDRSIRTVVPSCQFASDNTAGICPEAWDAMEAANQDGPTSPYGDDAWTSKAITMIREMFEVDCEVFFTFNGTAANSLALASLCQSYHSVIAHKIAHVETDECGGPEFFSNGTKLLLVDGDKGCVDCEEVQRIVRRRTDVHFPKPKVLSITQSTEMGTVYDDAALDRVQETVQRLGLMLHMDGARFCNAIAALNMPPKEMTWKRGVDVLCLGGTKLGMAVSDCVVFFDRELATEFKYRCKQAGQLASKMRFLSAPWVGVLQSGGWLQHAQHANAMAKRLAEGLGKLPGVSIVSPPEANAVFVDFGVGLADELRRRGWQFYDFISIGNSRLMCSWATTENEVDAFIGDVAQLTKSRA
ncbi:threonine aldolase family protein [Stieleria varia]|uniref:L-threonine aldolase n=1 Tax=Stieleria varia TaxID=2528005 RepID=A0A5C6ANT8_9BACT|nr:low specificity L-threonine aldolase [Stieleria varia]TWU01167.1 Low specificity L-threonine aldolase [Stieleria varia]